jgi:sugar (pentulose or hexulose) kinase
VGSIANTSPVLTGTSTTLSDDPETVGDVLVLLVHIVNSTATVSTVLGGGASGWAVDQQFSDFFGATQHDTEIWQGEVSSTGPSAITVRFSPSLAGTNVDVVAQEFTAGLGSATTWSQDGGAGQSNLSSSAVDYPSLTPSGSGELYFGYAWVPGTASAGSTPRLS